MMELPLSKEAFIAAGEVRNPVDTVSQAHCAEYLDSEIEYCVLYPAGCWALKRKDGRFWSLIGQSEIVDDNLDRMAGFIYTEHYMHLYSPFTNSEVGKLNKGLSFNFEVTVIAVKAGILDIQDELRTQLSSAFIGEDARIFRLKSVGPRAAIVEVIAQSASKAETALSDLLSHSLLSTAKGGLFDLKCTREVIINTGRLQVQPCRSIVINAPAFFHDQMFLDWLNNDRPKFTWHSQGDIGPNEYSDVVVCIDPSLCGDGSDSDMPEHIWCKILLACQEHIGPSNDSCHYMVRITNLL